MSQQIIIAEQLRIAAVVNEERVDALIVAQGRYQIGDVYLGTVENVLPGIDAAFINIGENEKNGFIHVSDLGPLRLKKASSGIIQLLEPQQKVLVQVIKEPTGTKGPRLTGNLTLPGRYLVLQPYSRGVNISRRIRAENERNRLRALGVMIKPPGASLLIRTEAEDVSEDLLIDDLETLLRQWEDIQQAAETANPPMLLNRDEDFVHRILRDLYSPELSKVVVDSPDAVERVSNFLGIVASDLAIEYYTEPREILDYYKINSAIRDALKPRVELPSGGYIIIEPMEALTVIDVNSGSFTRSANARETVLWTNCEAAIEIARQLKLRNIGGVIIIDFIDMELRRDQLQLLEHFIDATRHDTARPQIAQLTELGLVELTRKRQGQNIYELFGRVCSSCGGLGHLAMLPGQEDLQSLVNSATFIRSNNIEKVESYNSLPNTTLQGRRKNGRGKKDTITVEPKEILVKSKEVLIKSKEILAKPKEVSVKPKDVSIKPKDFSIKPKEVSIKPKEVSIKPKEVSIKPKEVSIKPKEVSIKPKEVSIKPKEVSVKPEPKAAKKFTKDDYINLKTHDIPDNPSELELLVIPMESEQITVYSWMGFSPVLLLDPPPLDDNIIIWVTQSNEDVERGLHRAHSRLTTPSFHNKNKDYSNINMKTTTLVSNEILAEAPPLVQDVLIKEVKSSNDILVNALNQSTQNIQIDTKFNSILPISETNDNHEKHHRTRRRRSSANS